MSAKTFTVAEVAKHKNETDGGIYIIVDSSVYDVTSMYRPNLAFMTQVPHVCVPNAYSAHLHGRPGFLDEHPGGAKILKRVAGKDASKQFWKYHNNKVLEKYGEKLKVGTVAETAKL